MALQTPKTYAQIIVFCDDGAELQVGAHNGLLMEREPDFDGIRQSGYDEDGRVAYLTHDGEIVFANPQDLTDDLWGAA